MDGKRSNCDQIYLLNFKLRKGRDNPAFNLPSDVYMAHKSVVITHVKKKSILVSSEGKKTW